MPEQTKKCSRCEKTKPLSQFYRSGQAWCRPCHRLYARERQQKLRDWRKKAVETGEDPQRFLNPERAKAEEDLYMNRAEWLKFRAQEREEVWGLLWDLLAHCGLRVHEALELTVGQFDRGRGCVMVQTLKQKRTVYHPVYIAQEDILVRVIGLEKQADELCFEMNYEKVYRRFKRIAKKAGLNVRYSPHALRHLQASEMYDTTRDLFAVKERLRHRSIKTTERYAHPSEDTLKEQAKAMRKRQEEGE